MAREGRSNGSIWYTWTMTYDYRGVPFGGRVASDLILDMYEAGQTLSRKQIIQEAADEHERRGGLPAIGGVTSVVKKALQVLAEQGRVESVSTGYWRFLEADSPSEVDEPVVVGEGPESVYTYYFPAYRDQAAYLKAETWPMKIGMTATSDVTLRVTDQSSTAMPEKPIVGLIYRTNNARNAEKMLHSVLIERDRKIKGSPGTEWFQTSIREVRAILDFATGSPAA